MRIGGMDVGAWLGGGPAHQLMRTTDGLLAYRLLPTADEAAREALGPRIERLADALASARRPAMPYRRQALTGDAWFLEVEDPVGRVVDRRVPAEVAVSLAARLLDALAGLHGAGVPHGALAPGRVVVAEGGAVYAMDAGMAALAEAAGEGALSPQVAGFGALWSTAWAIPPELLRGEPLSPASDVFGAAALLFRWAVGAPAHRGRRSLEVWRSLREGARVRAVDALPMVPPALARAVDAALAPEPRDRPDRAALRAALAEAGATPEGPLALAGGPPGPWSATLPRRDPADAPGPPGSDAERARQDAIRRATLALETGAIRRRPPRSRWLGVGLMVAAALFVAVIVPRLVPVRAPSRAPEPGATAPEPLPRPAEASPPKTATVTVGRSAIPPRPLVTRRTPEAEARQERRPAAP